MKKQFIGFVLACVLGLLPVSDLWSQTPIRKVTAIERSEFEKASANVLSENSAVLALRISRKDTGYNIVLIDPVTEAVEIYGPFSLSPNYLFSTAKSLYVTPTGQKIQEFSRDTKQPGRIFETVGRPLQASMFNSELVVLTGSNQSTRPSVEIFDLDSQKKIFSKRLPRPGSYFLWQDKLLEIDPGIGEDQGEITIFSSRLEKITSLPMPKRLNDRRCTFSEPILSGDWLIYQVGCAEMAIFDLNALRLVRIVGNLPQAAKYTYRIAERYLYAISSQSLESGIIDLDSGEKVLQLPLSAPNAAVNGHKIVTYFSRNFPLQGLISVYAVDATYLGDKEKRFDFIQLTLDQAWEKFIATRSDADLRKELDFVSPGFFRDSSLTEQQVKIAERYATWLAVSPDRFQEGIALLEFLHEHYPTVPTLAPQLARAYLRRYILLGSNQDLNKARQLSPAVGEALGKDLSLAKPVTPRPTAIDPSLEDRGDVFLGRNLVIARWRDNRSVVDIYDTDSYKLLASFPIIIPDSSEVSDGDQQDDVRGVTYNGNLMHIWLRGRFHDPKRPNLVLFNLETGTIEYKIIDSTAGKTIQFNDQILVCLDKISSYDSCDLIDARSLSIVKKEMESNLVSAVGQSTSEKIFNWIVTNQSMKEIIDFYHTIAISEEWIVAQNYGSRLYFGRDSALQNSNWKSFDLPLASRADAHFSQHKILLFIQDYVFRFDPESQDLTLLFDFPTGSMVIDDDLLIAGYGKHLFLFDLRTNRLAGFVPSGLQSTLYIDRDRLLLLGEAASEYFQLKELRAFADRNQDRLAVIERHLLQ